jgi:signal transduction histidine kinase
MTGFRTLRGRLTFVAVLAATVAVGLTVIVFNVVLTHTLNADVNSRLRSQAAAAATTVDARGPSLRIRESPNDDAIDSQVWMFEGDRPLLRARGATAVQRAAQELAGTSHESRDIMGDPEVRLSSLAITRQGRQVGTVVAGQSLEAYDRTTDLALIGTMALAGLVLLAVYGVTWWTIGRALDPVAAMTRSAAQWSEQEIDRRFGAEQRPSELGELAETFDALLDRLAASLRHEQRLSAELSHELRTPLARITAEVELLQRRERSWADRHEAYDGILRSTEQMSRILETLMAVARAEAQPHRGRTEIGPVLERVAQMWGEATAERHVALHLPDGQDRLAIGVDGDVVERILAPLLDNARRYARSSVRVGAERRAGRVLLTVHDDGMGIAPHDREAVFAPGVSGSDANGHGGAGLGLALARRLARAVDGDVRVAEPNGAGASFVVELPV